MDRADPHLPVYRQNAPRLSVCGRCRWNENAFSDNAALYPAKVIDTMAVTLFIAQHPASDKSAGLALKASKSRYYCGIEKFRIHIEIARENEHLLIRLTYN